MSFRRDQRGFIFSLDATLAVLIVLIVMAGVARVAGPELTYEQYGYLRLGRCANDALEVMQLTSTIDNIKNLLLQGDDSGAENLAKSELREILPAEVQFKLVVGDNRLAVYPSDTGDRAKWDDAFISAEEIAIAVRILTFPPKEPIRVLAWLDDPLDENFMTAVESGTGQPPATRVNGESDFRREIRRDGYRYYDVIFIPDANTTFTPSTKWGLVTFNTFGGTLVIGGETIWNNWETETDIFLWGLCGIVVGREVSRERLIGRPEFTRMHIVDDTHLITASPYYSCYGVEYAGEDYHQYVYQIRHWVMPPTLVLAEWDNLPPDRPTPWPGIIFRRRLDTSFGPTVVFNTRLAQSAMDPDLEVQPKGTHDWIALARRAIGYAEMVFEPITLYVWRGSAIE